jgi:hypothetical protein
MADPAFKAREAKARRKAQRLGYELRRNRVRDPDAPHYGEYQLWRVSTRGLAKPVVPGWLTLDEIEEALTS